MAPGRCRIFYVADIHGSERCFRKWLNAVEVFRPDALVFGGDIAGKVLVPIVEVSAGRFEAEWHGERVEFDDRESLSVFRRTLRIAGRHDVILTQEEKRAYDASPERVAVELFPRIVRDTVRSWMELADEKLAASGVPTTAALTTS